MKDVGKEKSQTLDKQVNLAFLSDHDRIQTYNLLSRNQMRYSVAPRGQLFFIKSLATPLFKNFSLFKAFSFESYSSKNKTFQGLYGLVDLVLPELC